MRPRHCYDDEDSTIYNDLKWIEAQLDQLPISMQKKVCERYSDIYLKLTNEEDFKARFRSNTWLRLTVNKHKVKQQEDYF